MTTPLRIGMIGLDTSHVIAFTELLNNPAHPHHIPGAKVAFGFPGGSKDFELSINRVEGFTKELREKHGVEILDRPEAVAEAADLVFIESVDGRVHLDQFRRTARYRKPTFIDKPLAVSSADAAEIVQIAAHENVCMTTASAMRYIEPLALALAPERTEASGPIVGVDVYGPMDEQPTQPGLFWYGIHSVEMIYAAMGPGCDSIHVSHRPESDLVTATWKDGRQATLRGQRKATGKFGAVIHRKKDVQYVDASASKRPGYASLLEAIIPGLIAGKPAVAPSESLEIIRFIESANRSRTTGEVVHL